MIEKLNEKVLLNAGNRSFRTAVIRKLNQIVDALNVGVVWDNKVDADRRFEVVEPVTSIAFVALAEANVIDEQTAVQHKEQFERWTGGVTYKVDQMRMYADRLYKCRQEHTSAAHQTPDIIPAIWKVIDLEHAGTLDDPIPAVVNMEYVKGKYYIEDGVIYLMNREGMAEGEGVVLAYLPSQLVGQYFEVVVI